MSDSHASSAPAAPLFTPVEVEQFDADDVTAGKAIGKMLSILFLYTVIVMSLVSWWTFSSVATRNAASEGTSATHSSH